MVTTAASLGAILSIGLLDPDLVNVHQPDAVVKRGSRGPATLRAQILLSRARFSPGEIDGLYGSSMAKAVRAFRAARELGDGDTVEGPVWTALAPTGAADPLMPYSITAEDVAGPFLKRVPRDILQQARLQELGYSSPLEALGEKFHCSPALLRLLNPGRTFTKAGEQIVVPSVDQQAPPPKAARVMVDRSDSSVRALDANGVVVAYYPASLGSPRDPLPIGTWEITGVARMPVFHYNPDLFWDADPSHSKAKIAAGPNNPVGSVWIDLSKEHYGIHGTPDPSTIGRTQSHGCIRLTNWDAMQLASMVEPGIPAILQP